MKRRRFFLRNFISVIIPTLVATLLVGSMSIALLNTYVNGDIKKSNMNLLSLVKINIESMFTDLDQYTLNFSANPNIIAKAKEVLSSKAYNYDTFQSMLIIENFINTPVNAREYLHSAYIYYKHYDKFFMTGYGAVELNGFYDKDWVLSVKNQDDKSALWIERRKIKQYDFEKKPTDIVSVSKKFLAPGASKSDGVVTINILQKNMDNMLSNLLNYSHQFIMVADSKSNVFFSSSWDDVPGTDDMSTIISNAGDTFNQRINGTPYLIYKTYSSKYDLYFISALPISVVASVMRELLLSIILVVFLALVSGIIFAYTLSNKSRRQIHTIISILDQYETKREFPNVLPTAADEYDYIIRNILKTFIENDMISRQLIERKHTLELFELKTLQVQINPHFLFNTLETIQWKSMEVNGGYSDVNKMIENLSSILKYCLRNAEEKVSISEEIKYTKCYNAIQSIRYHNKYRLIWEYDEAVINYKMIKLLFQPLLENSINHGIMHREDKGLIKVKIELKAENVKITIIDNGIGMSKERLREVRSSLENELYVTQHIGLINTNHRIKLLYGQQFGIRIYSKANIGSVLYLTLPKEI